MFSIVIFLMISNPISNDDNICVFHRMENGNVWNIWNENIFCAAIYDHSTKRKENEWNKEGDMTNDRGNCKGRNPKLK